MCSVGSRDGRNMLAFGQMEEIEEGEAFSYENGDDDANIDPDVAFSYIDEKLQSVLGHFKKDFEGGISSENLGAKYGGYGSFLTQRSPVWSSAKIPSKKQINYPLRSPVGLQLLLEQGHHSSVAQLNRPSSVNHRPISNSSASSRAYKASTSLDTGRQSLQPQVRQISLEPPAKVEVANKSASFTDQRKLKVRIKVGSDNLSAEKNAAIYSGLGLDDSPNSSFDNNPVDCQGVYQFGAEESPTHIIQTMTSFPINGEHLLSPLPESLASLTEKIIQDSSAETPSELSKAKSMAKLMDEAGLSKELKEGGEKESIDGFDQLLKKETDFNAFACEEQVSKDLKLPLLSSSHDTSTESTKGGLGGSPCVPCEEWKKKDTRLEKSNSSLYMLKLKSVKPVPICNDDLSKKQNREVSSAKKVDVRKLDLKNDASSLPAGDRDGKREPANSSSNKDATAVSSKGKKSSNSKVKDPQKERIRKISTYSEQDRMNLHPGDKQSPTNGKKKQKGSKAFSSPANEVPKVCIKNGGSWRNDSTDAFKSSFKIDSESLSVPKDLGQPKDRYRDFFGEINDDGDDLMESPDMPPVGCRLKIPQLTEKSISRGHTSRERSSSKGTREQSTAVHPNQVQNITHHSDNRPPISGLAPGGFEMKDDWVCCDKCQKWRLLPPGFVETLPDKWLCSMLNWLPGMNSCNVTEEETTKAVREHYQLLAQSVNGAHGPLPGVVPGFSASSGLHSHQLNSNHLPGGLKKNHVLQEVGNSKSALQQSMESKNLADPVGSQRTDFGFQQIRSSAHVVSVTEKSKKKSKKKSLPNYSDGGHSKIKKHKSETDPDTDYARASKKIRTGGIQATDKILFSSGNQGNIELLHAATKKRKTDTLDCAPSSSIVCENEQILQKKARMSNPEEKNFSSSRGSSKADKKRKCSRKCSATSSSSNVSGSYKSKSNFQEAKGSAVTSVSSLALRSMNSERKTSMNLVVKHGTSVKETIKRQADGETQNSGGSRSDPTPKKLFGNHHVSPESSMLDLVDKNSSFVEAMGNASDDIGFCLNKSAKDYMSHSMDKNQKDNSQPDRRKSELSESYNDLRNGTQTCKNKPRNNRVKAVEKFGLLAERNREHSAGKNILSRDALDGGGQKVDKLKSVEPEDSTKKADILCNHEVFSSTKNKAKEDAEDRRNIKRPNQEIDEQMRSVTEKEKSGINSKLSNQFAVPNQGNVMCSSTSIDGHLNKSSQDQVSKTKAGILNGINSVAPKLPNGHDQDTASCMSRDSRSQAAQNALKEATDLKHLADRRKDAGSVGESTGLYLQASLQFLHGASLLETSSSESGKRGEMSLAKDIYSSTAQLCEFCAHEYEKLKDMAAAALAYKCMEVAYLRVIYSSYPAASRCCHELRSSLPAVLPGESPSSSASDIDNASNPATGEKVGAMKDGSSPRTVGKPIVITARNRPIFSRLLNHMQVVNSAIEASRKAQGAFTNAKIGLQHQTQSKDGIPLVKRALDFNFHDVEGLLHLVRHAAEAINL